MQLRKANLLLAGSLITFVFCYAVIAFFNRYASDDFEFLYQCHQHGFKGSVSYFYNSWNTRWISIGWMNLIFLCTAKIGSLLPYHLVSFSLLWISFYRLVKSCYLNSLLSGITISGFMSISFFYSCFSVSDVFFWINTSTMYLYGSIAFLFALGEVLSQKKNKLGFLLLIASGFFLGGSYEPLAFTAMAISACYLIYIFRREGSMAAARTEVIKIIIFLSVLMIAFAISYAGEGHLIRSNFLPQTTFSFKIIVLLKAIFKMFILYLPGKILPALLFAFPWFFIGMINPFHQLTNKKIKFATVLFILLIIISLAPLALIMSEMGPERAWTQISIYLVLYTALVAAYAGSVLRGKYREETVLLLYSVTAFLYILATCIPQMVQSFQYSKAYDIRMKKIEMMKSNTILNQVQFLEKLPASGWLHSAEITAYPKHFTNQHLKKYLDLNFDVAIVEDRPVK